MADSLTKTKALTHWRRNGRDTRLEHTREVVKEELPENARKALLMLAEKYDDSQKRILRLERLIGSLAHEALKDA
jgi:hypothetical protein